MRTPSGGNRTYYRKFLWYFDSQLAGQWDHTLTICVRGPGSTSHYDEVQSPGRRKYTYGFSNCSESQDEDLLMQCFTDVCIEDKIRDTRCHFLYHTIEMGNDFEESFISIDSAIGSRV